MCGRFYLDDHTEKEMESLISYIRDQREVRPKGGDIYPTNISPVIIGENAQMVGDFFNWGFSNFNKSLIINARSESVLDKPMFSQSVTHRRLVIPARGFYEWDKSKNKYRFELENQATMFLAGCYNLYEDGYHFVILTTKPNDSMAMVHDRMPLIFTKKQIKDWILDDSVMKDLLKIEPPMLEKHSDYEQATFDFI